MRLSIDVMWYDFDDWYECMMRQCITVTGWHYRFKPKILNVIELKQHAINQN